MAKKKKKKGKMPAALKAYWAKKRGGKSHKSKKHHQGATVAKKKSKKSKHHRKHPVAKRHHRRGGGGLLGGLPITEIVAGAAVGWIERESKTDPNFMLNKLPTPIDQIGKTGNLVLLAWAASKFGVVPSSVRHYVNAGVKAGAAIVAYQMMRQNAAFTKGDQAFTISGPAPERIHGKHGYHVSSYVDGSHSDGDDYIDDDGEYVAGDDAIGAVDGEWHADVNIHHTPESVPTE